MTSLLRALACKRATPAADDVGTVILQRRMQLFDGTASLTGERSLLAAASSPGGADKSSAWLQKPRG